MGNGTVAEEITKVKSLLPTYLHLIVSAIFPIYAAAHASLRRPVSAARVSKSHQQRQQQLDDDDDDESKSPVETLTTSDAILFPLLAGVTLSFLYIIIKWLEDPAILNKLLGYYFSWVGIFFTFTFLRDCFHLLRAFTFPSRFSSKGVLYEAQSSDSCFTATPPKSTSVSDSTTSLAEVGMVKFIIWPLSKYNQYWKIRRIFYKQIFCLARTRKPLTAGRLQFNVSLVDLAAAVVASLLALLSLWLGNVPWYLTNLSGFSFCYGSLQLITPGTAATGSLLLSLLFLYDIYMVFYTPMMVTVATKLDVPIKLLFPRPDDGTCIKPIGVAMDDQEMKEYLRCLAKKRTMAMLGLGDIVVPGIMIAYALRFDLYNYYRKMSAKNDAYSSGQDSNSSFSQRSPKPNYLSARGMWAERCYTARGLWPESLRAKSFPKPYFKATACGYVVGMIATVIIMQVYNHAQPALLYLVPGVLSAFWGLSLWRGEVKVLWHYDEAAEEKETEQKRLGQQEKRKDEKKAKATSDVDEPVKNKTAKARKAHLMQEPNQNRSIFSFNIYSSSMDTIKPHGNSLSNSRSIAESISIAAIADTRTAGSEFESDTDIAFSSDTSISPPKSASKRQVTQSKSEGLLKQ